MPWEEIPNVNKDFTLSREQEKAQKLAREHQEQRREAALEQINDIREREKIEKLKEEREKEAARTVKMERDHQDKRELREIQRRIDNQKFPHLTPETAKSGKSPDQIAREVRKQYEQHRDQQIQMAREKTEDIYNKMIDKRIDQALERQRQEERGDLVQDQSFQKDAEKSARDRFDGAAKAKDWRQVQAERMRDEFEKGR